MAADPFFVFLNNNGLWVMIGVIVVSAIVFGALKDVLKTRAKEESRREIAAYIAEGSMTPEQGERLMRAGASSDEC